MLYLLLFRMLKLLQNPIQKDMLNRLSDFKSNSHRGTESYSCHGVVKVYQIVVI